MLGINAAALKRYGTQSTRSRHYCVHIALNHDVDLVDSYIGKGLGNCSCVLLMLAMDARRHFHEHNVHRALAQRATLLAFVDGSCSFCNSNTLWDKFAPTGTSL